MAKIVSFIKDLSVKWRLIWFVIFLLLLVTAAGWGGLNGMRVANLSLATVYTQEVLPLKELKDLDEIFQLQIVAPVDKVLFEQISWSDCLRLVEQGQKELDVKWQAQFAMAGSGDDTWLLPAKNLTAMVDEAMPRLVSMIQTRDVTTLDAFTDATLYPLATEYAKVVNQLVDNRLQAVKVEFESSQQRYNLSKKFFTITLIVALAISVLASLLLIRSINTPLGKMSLAIKAMMQGDLTHHPSYHRNDEFGLLIKGFNQMTRFLADLVHQVQRSGIQVTSSITEIAATNKQQEVTANEHAATASQIAASSTEIAATAAQLLKNMKTVDSLTRNAVAAAEEGQSGLDSLNSTMTTMEKATGAIVEKLSILSEKAGNIAGVVKTINKVADQTNLLSLNAAIEAEKAGEYGAGFSVVATEIRRLADQTAVATYDIEQMVQDVQSAISAAVMGIDKFAEDASQSVSNVSETSDILAGVIEQVQILRPQVVTLNKGIDAQQVGAQQISEAIGQLKDAAQQTAESLSQTSSSISQLQEAAMGLQEGISRFKVEEQEGEDERDEEDEDRDDAAAAV